MELPLDVQERIRRLKALDLKALERTEELGRDYSFKPVVELLRQIITDLEQVLEGSSLLRVPTNIVERIKTIVIRTEECAAKIDAFVLKGNELAAAVEHKRILDKTTALFQEDLEVLVPLIERINLKQLNPSELGGKISEALKEVEQIQNIRQEAEKEKLNVELAFKEVRDTFGTTGAGVSSKNFREEALAHNRLAIGWFWGAAFSIALTVLLIFAMFYERGPFKDLSLELVSNSVEVQVSTSTPSILELTPTPVLISPTTSIPTAPYVRIVQIVIFKLLLLSIAYLLIYQSIRNYKINRHLYIINRHRQLTLEVYPLMAKATSSQEQSNTIVGQASKAIFEPGTTGYLDGNDNPNPINLTEIINKVVDKAN